MDGSIDVESHPARATDPISSHMGANSMAVKRGTVRYQVFTVFVGKWPKGASNEDICNVYQDILYHTLTPRVAELRDKKGYIEESGLVPGSQGTDIMTWRLTPRGELFAKSEGLVLGRQHVDVLKRKPRRKAVVSECQRCRENDERSRLNGARLREALGGGRFERGGC